METTSAPPILLPGIDHLPCLQEIRSVKDKPFYCQSSVGTIPFQGRVFLLLAFCKQNASLQQLLSHMATVCLSTNCPRANSIIQSSWPHELGKVEHEPGKSVIIISSTKLSWPHELGNVENEPEKLCYHNFHHKTVAPKLEHELGKGCYHNFHHKIVRCHMS